MWPRRAQEIQIKTPEQFAIMREAGLVVARTLAAVAAAVRPGVSTAELDALAEREIRAAGATPVVPGLPRVSRHDLHVGERRDRARHPEPGPEPERGDIISIDCGAIVRGWHGDAAVTVGVGTISAEHAALLRTCEDALWQGLAQARAGARLGDISHAVEASIEPRRVRTAWSRSTPGTASAPPCTWIRRCPNYGRPGRGLRLRAGMALAIEPMVMLGSPETVLLDDGWTVITADGSWAAHFEHTVAITADGPWVLTAEDGGQARLGDTRHRDPASVPPD